MPQSPLSGSSSHKRALISIVVINYNYGCFLEDCLQSIADQSYGGSIECIVIDNASTDGSEEVFANFAADRNDEDRIRFSFHRMPENIRQTRGCYEGYRLSSGHFVAFLDADDWILPSYIESHVYAHLTSRVAVAASSVDMLQETAFGVVAATTPSFTAYVDGGVGRLVRFQRDLDDETYRLLLSDRPVRPIALSQVHLVDRWTSSKWVWSPTSSLMFRREALDLMFATQPTIEGSADAFLLRGAGSLAGTMLIDAPLAVYRRHGRNFFARGMPLAGFRSFAPDQLRDEDRQVARAVIAAHLENRAMLSTTLLEPDHFIEAIAIAAASGLESLTAENPRFMADFIVDNREALVASFGAQRVTIWADRFDTRRRSTRYAAAAVLRRR